MERHEIILSALLTISVSLNIIGAVYIREAVKRLLSISLELVDLQKMVESFTAHLQTVYELESFYGDETLKALLDHATSFNEQMDTFEYFISLTEETETDDPEDNDNADEATPDEDPEPA